MRKTIIVICCCIATLLLGYTGYRGYKVWKQGHWLTMAKDFAAKADARNEMLCLQQVLRLNPQNLEACRMMANLADAARSPGALVWRQRVIDLDGKSMSDRLALAQTALLFSDFNVATNALAGVDEVGKKTALYHNAAGIVFSTAGQVAIAQGHFIEAARLEPENPVLQMNVAVLRLHGSNALELAEARISLKQISQTTTNQALRSQAQRELIIDALRFEDRKAALAIANELSASTNATFSDRLMRLEVLQQSKSPELKSALVSYQREAAANPRKLADLAVWLLRRTTPAETLIWLQSLPAETRTNQPAALLVAGCQLALADWKGLQASIQNQKWEDLEFFRHAFLARALRGQDLSEASAGEWVVASNLASNQKGALIQLFRLAADWQWNSEAEQILWTLLNKYPDEKWVAPLLTQALMADGRTRSLMQLFGILAKRFPSDVELKNNLACTAMLLGAGEVNPFALAQEVYAANSKNPSYVSTYALALYLQKKYPEALKVMQQLPQKELENPSVAGCYALILKATGNDQKAADYFKLAAQGRLLPEEKKLFQQAGMK